MLNLWPRYWSHLGDTLSAVGVIAFTLASLLVVDLAQSSWDWSANGEPPMDNPAYYLRYCKTFSRMGGTMAYLSAHNRDFLLTLARALNS